MPRTARAPFVARSVTRVLRGHPASISGEYSARARALLASYLMSEAADEELAGCIRPRAPLPVRTTRLRDRERVIDFARLRRRCWRAI